MPIRSPRGRVAAYRALWQWPLRSPARLAVSGVAALAVVLGISTALTAINPPEPAPAGVTTTGTNATAPGSTRSTRAPGTPVPTALPPVSELAPTSLPVSSAPAAALQAAASWSAAWIRPPDGTPADRWIEGLRPFTTEEYLGVLATVDPGAVPATVVTGPARAVRVAASSVDVEVPTDALTLLVLVVRTEAGDWRVSGYDRAA
ncbi:hypothetical protein [Pseudonocardia abyssalis]|uniref:Uncharacterized protein n=1 Tax=Pseudonocardia abyssalis TaxID=2792008 RepID=A0ABS6UZ09_9PSEU|nr:hypothetical protein [Pseudonocardia abyssalis]MBW0137510.1 hypothetical protein [Pseudonocardia abyssalis]